MPKKYFKPLTSSVALQSLAVRISLLKVPRLPVLVFACGHLQALLKRSRFKDEDTELQVALASRLDYLCRQGVGSMCHSPSTHFCQNPPWCSLGNMNTPPHLQTGTPPHGPPHLPRTEVGRRTPLCMIKMDRTSWLEKQNLSKAEQSVDNLKRALLFFGFVLLARIATSLKCAVFYTYDSNLCWEQDAHLRDNITVLYIFISDNADVKDTER